MAYFRVPGLPGPGQKKHPELNPVQNLPGAGLDSGRCEPVKIFLTPIIIDTPGIREFGLSGVQRQELAQFFPEIAALAPNCRFKNCAHIEEPDCAVQAAQAAGQIAASRYHSYKQIYAALEGLARGQPPNM